MPKKLEKVNVAKCKTCTHGHRCLEIAKYGHISIMNCRHYSPKDYNFEFKFIPGDVAYVLHNGGLTYLSFIIQSVLVDCNGVINYKSDDIYFTDSELGVSVFKSEEEAQKKVRSNVRASVRKVQDGMQ